MVVTAILAVILGISGYILFNQTPPKPKYAEIAAFDNEDVTDAGYERQGRWFGLCQKNSVHSVDDFRRTISEDPVLGLHFADFRWEEARMGRLENEVMAYVYFRKDNLILQTKKPIRLPAGDEYITDGIRVVRTTCCNDYKVTNPVSEASAGSGTEDTPEAHREMVLNYPAEVPLASQGFSGTSQRGAVPKEFHRSSRRIGFGITVPPTPSVPETASVPEPGMIQLVGTGVAGMLIVFFIGNRFTRKKKAAQRKPTPHP
jgi:hypothetical protein